MQNPFATYAGKGVLFLPEPKLTQIKWVCGIDSLDCVQTKLESVNKEVWRLYQKRGSDMVALIEDQIHQFLIDQEEERCKAIEATYEKNEKTKGKKVQRKTIPKPWMRAVASALCQEADLLAMVSQYDYDLSDAKFQAYCSTRGILHVAGEPGSRRWKYYADHQINKDAFLADPYFQFSQEIDGKRIHYTDTEMETSWKIMLLGRAQLQDCWELYRRK